MATCDVCRALGAATAWGEAMGETLPRDPPAEVRRLAHVSGDAYRCPTCGNLYERGKSSDSFLNATYDSEYVRRLRPLEAPSEPERAEAHARVTSELAAPEEAVRRTAAALLAGDSLDRLDDLRRELLDRPDPVVRVTALKCLREDSRHIPFERLAPLETCLRDMIAGGERDVRSEAKYLLALHLLAADRRSEVVALLDTTEPPELGPILRLLVSRLHGPVNVEELLPHLRRALRVEDDAGFTPHAVHELLSNEPTRSSMLAALDGWTREGDSIPMTAETLGLLVETLMDPGASAPALRLLQAAAKRGARISETLPWLRVSLKGSLPTWFSGRTVHDLIEALIDADGSFEPLLRWLGVLALEKPAEAVAHLGEILERGQDISVSRDAVKHIASEAGEPRARVSAAALLKRMQHPPGSAARRRMAQVKDGTLAFGGGGTTDTMAVLHTKDGKFFIGGPDVESREVSRSRALAFLVSLYALKRSQAQSARRRGRSRS